MASYVFYGWWRPDFVLLMWISTVVDYTCGSRIRAAQDGGSAPFAQAQALGLPVRRVHLIAAIAGATTIWLFPTTQKLLYRTSPLRVLPLRALF